MYKFRGPLLMISIIEESAVGNDFVIKGTCLKALPNVWRHKRTSSYLWRWKSLQFLLHLRVLQLKSSKMFSPCFTLLNFVFLFTVNMFFFIYKCCYVTTNSFWIELGSIEAKLVNITMIVVHIWFFDSSCCILPLF